MKTFTELAREALQDLVQDDGSIREFQGCRGEEHVIISQNGIEIDLGYEPFGPPWCFVANRSGSRIRIGSEDAMNRDGTFDQTHNEQLMKWICNTRPLIEAYLNTKEAQQAMGGNRR